MNLTEYERQGIEYIKTVSEKCRPVVVISCLAYNQEVYIRETLQSFVSQKTNFSFVAIVHDDASTDGTTIVIKEFVDRYPDIILPIYEKKNQYSKHDGSLGRIMQEARNATGAKYVALCEGDDYWTDPLKLQKQVDFLETHSGYSMCFHNAIEHFEGNSRVDKLFSNLESRDYTGVEIYANWIVPTASVVVRREVFELDIYKRAKRNKKFIFGDILLFLSAASYGKTYAMEDVMSVYRRHEGGVTHYRNIDSDLKTIEHQKAIVEVFGPEFKRIANRHISNLYMSIRYKYRSQGLRLKAILSLFKSMSYDLMPVKTKIKVHLRTWGLFLLACRFCIYTTYHK